MKFIKKVIPAVVAFAFAMSAQAASLLDTAMTTSINGGLTDIEDTVVALLALVFGAVITVTILKRLPSMVKGFLGSALGK